MREHPFVAPRVDVKAPVRPLRRPGGIVYLVGAGPGDPDLITVKGRDCLRRADVVVHDRLAAPLLLDEAPAAARRIDVGKIPGVRGWTQVRINRLLVSLASQGKTVVRLKGGDPFVFGRGGEECQALARAGLKFEVIPGVSSAVSAPAAAGIPVTHRGRAHAFTVVAGHTAGPDELDQDWEALARAETLVILMGLHNLPHITERLLAAGRAPGTPAAVVSRATTGEQAVVRGTLADIAALARGLPTPATIVIGEVVELAGEIAGLAADAGVPDQTQRPAWPRARRTGT